MLKLVKDTKIKGTAKGYSFTIDGKRYFLNPFQGRLFLIEIDGVDIASMPEEKNKPVDGEWVDFGKGN